MFDEEYQKEIDPLKENIKKLRKESELWAIDFRKIGELRAAAISFEKDKDIESAIAKYEESVKFGENSTRLNLSNYAYDLDRLFIL